MGGYIQQRYTMQVPEENWLDKVAQVIAFIIFATFLIVYGIPACMGILYILYEAISGQ